MKNLTFLCFFLMLTGCDTASQILFSAKSELPKPIDLQKRITPTPPIADFYGRGIFVITYDNYKTDYGQGLYHALNQSLSRNPNGFYLIVGYYSETDSFVMKQSLKLRAEMENMGLDAQKIIIKTMKKNPNETNESVRLYER